MATDRRLLKIELRGLVESTDADRQRVVDKIAMILTEDPSLEDYLHELEEAQYLKHKNETSDRYAVWMVCEHVIVDRNGDNKHSNEYVAHNTLLKKFGEGSSLADALRDMLSACKNYANFLYIASKGDFKRWPELEHVFVAIEQEGGVESWYDNMDRKVNEWLATDPE